MRVIHRLALIYFIWTCLLNHAISQATWSNDIACMIYSHCTDCHNPQGIAPFSLLEYEDVYNYRFAIESAITRGVMPPWPADPQYRHFQNENILTTEEIEIFKAWVTDNAPKGEINQAPPVPTFDSKAKITDPDLVLELPVYEVPPLSDKDLYRCFAFDIDLPQDAFITAFEVIPGNPSIVHHALIYESSSSRIDELDAADPDPGYVCFGGIGVADVTGLGGWVPGAEAQYFPDGMGLPLPAKTKIVVQVHYPEYGAGQIDSTKVLFKLSYDQKRALGNAPILNHSNASLINGPLYIPANTVKTFENRFTVPVKATIFSITPHAHLICEAMKSYAVTPQGDTIKLIDIPKWDFDWQKTYEYRRPIVIPAGSVLHGVATYNNTSSNDHNPNVPPKDVSLGEATTDEMMLFYFTFSGYQSGDDDLIFEEDGHFHHYLDCEYGVLTSVAENEIEQFTLIPNPANEAFTVHAIPEHSTLQIFDAIGVEIYKSDDLPSTFKVETSAWKPGVYFVRIEKGGKSQIKRVLINR